MYPSNATVHAVLAVVVVAAALSVGGCGSSVPGGSVPGGSSVGVPWTWPDRSIQFTVGGGKLQPRRGHLDGEGDLIDDRGGRHQLDEAVREQARRWLEDPDALGRRAADLNCSVGSDEPYVMLAFAAPGTVAQPFTFCVEDLGRLAGGTQLRTIVQSIRQT
jgi:hypothetical protein